MDIGSLLLILALLILVVLYISRPFFERRLAAANSLADQEDHELSHLLAERDRILNALQELDFDNALGKIPEEDYPAQRSFLLQRGADILRRIDSLQPGASNGSAEARLEATVAARQAGSQHTQAAAARLRANQVAQVAGADDDLEVLLANRRRERREKSAGFCPQCGGPLQESDRFCPKCGSKLA